MSDAGGIGSGGVGGFIRRAINEGLGVTRARAMFRESELGRMSNAAFGQLYGQVRSALGARDQLAGLDYAAIPDGDVFTPWAAGTPDRYASFVEVFVREVGSRDVTSRFYTHVTSDPHSPQEAVDAAMDVITGGSATGFTPYDEVPIDGVVTSMTRTVARA